MKATANPIPSCHVCGATTNVRQMSARWWCRRCWNSYVRNS